jgi:D-alanyl-D-alanine carboxypeptidase/D-alanyl-D-alanine-endopeptidase (penicillin-binding protein 4)
MVLPPTDYLVLSNRTHTAAPGKRSSVQCYRPLGRNLVYVSGELALGDPGRTNAVTFHDPAGLFASVLKRALVRNGVIVKGPARPADWLERQANPIWLPGAQVQIQTSNPLGTFGNLIELGSVASLPLSDIAKQILKPSQNLYTDLLLAHVGEGSRTADTPSDTTSEDLGIRELNKFLTRAGIVSSEVIFEEGSGLSRNNLTTANATVALLQYVSRRPYAEVFLQALPVAGVDGTLRGRMKGSVAEGNLRAKTGTLRWADSLSGYVTSRAGEHLVFSIMLNRYHRVGAARPARAELDAVALLLAGFAGRSE